jgi:hypothetical protein
MIFNSENYLILIILIQTKCHKIPGSVLIKRYDKKAQFMAVFSIDRDGGQAGGMI